MAGRADDSKQRTEFGVSRSANRVSRPLRVRITAYSRGTNMRHFQRTLLNAASVLLLGATLALSQPTSAFASETSHAKADDQRGLVATKGYFTLWRDAAKGRLLLGVDDFNTPFLMIHSLSSGLGSNDVGLDRGQSGDARLVEFRRIGQRVLLVESNTRFVAKSNNADEVRSVREAFAESVLWAGDIVAAPPAAGKQVLVDISSLVASDLHGIAGSLARSGQGKYSLDERRSAALADEAKTFPDNTELEGLLTFKGDGEGQFVRDVAMDAQSISLRQHLSLVRLPPAGYVPRRYHPASGAISAGYFDFAQPLSQSLDVRYQRRFRLDAAADGTVGKPIVFYVDRGAPEPVRSALIDGANWWRSAFEKAGYKDAYRVELLPEGVDPMDVRYNVIVWAHRHTRGWSYGHPIVDPRSGEIIRGAVILGSQRVRQDILIAEALLAPYDKTNAAELSQEAEQMALARLRQLSAHEVGHALGFAHNFSASRHGNGSVLDYPHPLLDLDEQGSIRLKQAYGVGVGAWDDFVVAHAYSAFAKNNEAAELAKLRADIAAAGYRYLDDQDARSPGDAEPDGLLWDFGSDSLKSFDRLLLARRRALDQFGIGVLPPDRQIGELEARLVPIYLLHRYQTEGVARLLGGVSYRYSSAADRQAGSAPVAAERQHAALLRLVKTLTAAELVLPNAVMDLMTPPASGYERGREYFTTLTAPTFDPLAAAAASSAVTMRVLFAPERLGRLAWQHSRDAAMPGIGDLMDALFAGTWKNSTTGGVPEAVQLSANWVVVDAALASLEGGKLHPQVAAQLRANLNAWQAWLAKSSGKDALSINRREAAQLIARYLADPKSVTLRALPAIPPGAPI